MNRRMLHRVPFLVGISVVCTLSVLVTAQGYESMTLSKANCNGTAVDVTYTGSYCSSYSDELDLGWSCSGSGYGAKTYDEPYYTSSNGNCTYGWACTCQDYGSPAGATDQGSCATANDSWADNSTCSQVCIVDYASVPCTDPSQCCSGYCAYIYGDGEPGQCQGEY